MASVRGGPERAAAWLARHTTAIAATLLIAAIAFIAADHYLGLFPAYSARLLRRVAKGFGSLAGILAIIAAGYYLWREICGGLLKRAVIHPEATPKTILGLLRLTHPLVGVAAIAAAVLHGSLLWSGRWPLREVSGLAALAALLLLAVSGWPLADGGRGRGLRMLHRYTALAFLLLLAVH